MPLEIAHIGPSALPITHPYGGAIERRMMELAKAQVARGSQVSVYSAEDRDSVSWIDGFEIRSLACRRQGLLRRFEFVVKALRDLKPRPPDVLHFHSVPLGGAMAKSFSSKKILSYDYYAFGGGKRTPLYWCYKRALRDFDWLLPVSDYCLENSVSFWNLRASRVRTLYNGVNLRQFQPDPSARESRRRLLGIAHDDKVVLYVGRVCLQKGSDVLVQAYIKLREQIPAAKLVVAGPAERFGTSSPASLTRQIIDAGGIYLGAVHESELAEIYNACDVFVMPTRTWEMFGMAAAEAQACGKPVVCSKHGGLVEVIARNSGSFFPVGDSGALAHELATLLLNDALRVRMGLAARENATRFDWDRLAGELEAVYTGIESNRSEIARPHKSVWQ